LIPSLPETFARLAPQVPEVLVPREMFSRFSPVLQTLPSVRNFSFECRLGEGEGQVDLLATLTPAWGGETLCQEGPEAARAAGRVGPSWEGVRAFCAGWVPPQAPFRGEVPLLWLEFDLEPCPPAVPPPFVTFCIQPEYIHRRLVRGPLGEGHPLRERAWRAVEVLGGRALEEEIHQALKGCLESLPPRGALMHVAPAYGRGARWIRLVLTLPSRDVESYLKQVGWESPSAEIPKLLQAFRTSSEVDLYLDVGERVQPQVGLGCGLLHAEEPRAAVLFERLTSWGCCTPEKRDGVLEWLGQEDRVALPGLGVPVQVLRWATVKVVHRPDRPLLAKAYPEFHLRPRLWGGSRLPATY